MIKIYTWEDLQQYSKAELEQIKAKKQEELYEKSKEKQTLTSDILYLQTRIREA